MKFIVKGGCKLEGEVTLSGAKNAATKMMIASLLTDEECFLENFPRIGDTEITADLCKAIGSKIDLFGSRLSIHTPKIITSKIEQARTRRNRIPILALGPLLARAGEAEVPVLGGDKIGSRPVDQHVKVLELLGVEVSVTGESYRAKAPNGLIGTKIELDFPSVGATENAILSGVLAKGKTTIYNAALEPEIMDLVKMLQKMGAIIELGAKRDFHIEGVKKLKGVTHRILPDRNEAVSFACLAIATGGKVLVKGAIQDHLITFLNTVRKLGAEYEVLSDGIVFSGAEKLLPIHVQTVFHPGFMTDWQQPLMVLLTQVDGTSIIHETVYEDRLGYTSDLNAMGADISVSDICPPQESCRYSGKGFRHVATVRGYTPLSGTNVTVRDLRAGMVNIIAALIAKGDSVIDGVEEIDRGYESIDLRLHQLGADITRVAEK
ncbi:MAG: UDP-N-acetylglucosamine 1-carboxyvinyltransferase [Candidatus Harrisonbacteria bacterium CG10_big_fil_rev_8_21_14_0_10_40_38]|uniref:UDP-N-acetylglucosamine 1-carboxyvinyltransferase n=1 Tax=Candidatus Harrisonbacteria bacterium CG10_big_fil_rev_8_21_14_0_10_40_38 TaxID=1974583 RepID=A0A2H0US51_9BACT|nr:MAG: UDP-N-acetylglucosamine 1-carboxyvinyltransferase [Candidatus Harrisonbacteria bacterium CG10_big_fil_rev_8_21_14_0_10_40_38]